MSLSSKEAAETLSDVERAARRSARAYSYNRSSPHLIIWGLCWVIGYAGTYFFLPQTNLVWAATIVAGMVASTITGKVMHTSCDAKAGARHGLRMFGLIGIAAVFMGATYAIMGPLHGLQPAAFPALLVAAAYCAVGLWLGTRYLILGALVFALTLAGYFYLPQYYLLWMGFVGGGALILTGLWFRKV